MVPDHINKAAVDQAKLSNGVGRNKNYRLGAVVFVNHPNDPVPYGLGHNSYNSHPLTAFYEYPHMHAETHAMIEAGTDFINGYSLFVTRIRKDGRQTMAKPCKHCIALMKHVGLKNVYYTNWEGEVECINLDVGM